jgi:hypothetical protein
VLERVAGVVAVPVEAALVVITEALVTVEDAGVGSHIRGEVNKRQTGDSPSFSCTENAPEVAKIWLMLPTCTNSMV